MSLRRFLLLLFLCLAVAGAHAERLKQGEILRVWKKGGVPAEGKSECRVGDTIVVEVRDFAGWLMNSLDNQFFTEDAMVKGLEKGSITALLIDAGRFHDAVKVLNDEKTSSDMKYERVAALLAKGRPAKEGDAPRKVTSDDEKEVRRFLKVFMAEKMALLTLELDHDTLAGVKVGNPSDSAIDDLRRPPEGPDNSYHWLEYRLDVVAANSDVWSRLRASPSFRRPMGVTLSLNLGTRSAELPTKVEPGKEGGFDFGINLIPRYRFGAALVLWAVATCLLLRLSGSTDLLRDPDGEIRPDGRRCFSLARSQMACWFLLVIGAYLFLWVVTGSYDTLNDTCLWLIGIGTGTALGAALISDPKDRDARAFPMRIDHEVPDKQVLERLKNSLQTVRDAVVARADATVMFDGREISAPDHINALEKQITAYEDGFAQKTPFKRLLDDWLRERGLYSFHRYQMLVWTLAMALIFVVEVWRTLKMPVFNMTALALMGISSGTYLGFKLKDKEPKK